MKNVIILAGLSVQRFQQISGEETIHAHREANTDEARKLHSEAQLTLPLFTQSNREAKAQATKERSRCIDDGNDPAHKS